MPRKDPYGDRMKAYERVTRLVLPRRTFTIVRVDGKAFHTYLRGAEKPFDPTVMDAMQDVGREMCKQISGARFAYQQSDEVSVLLTDLDPKTEPWFDGQVQKIASVAASIATMAFNRHHPGFHGPERSAMFDGRVYTIPDRSEVINYFRWRQQDAIRNAVAMAAQAHFPHKSLYGLDSAQLQEKLFQEKGINFKNEYPAPARRGALIHRVLRFVDVSEEHQKKHGRPAQEARSEWVAAAAPEFGTYDSAAVANLFPGSSPGAVPDDMVELFGYTLGTALLNTAADPAGALWAAKEIQERMGDNLFRAWMIGMNPLLGDQSPLLELLRGNVSEVLKAHRSYLKGDATS